MSDFTDSDLSQLNGVTFHGFVAETKNLGREEQIRLLRRLADLVGARPATTKLLILDEIIDTATVYNEIGYIQTVEGDSPGAIVSFRLALAAARVSNNEGQIYKSLHCLGLCFLDRGEVNEALRHFQLSAQHANHATPMDMISTLEWTAICWQRSPTTISHAAALYDWICLLQPTRMYMHIEKYRCLLAAGDNLTVEQAAANVSSDDCLTLITAVAANSALGRKRKACRLAREGWQLANTMAEKSWRAAFETYLQQCSSKARMSQAESKTTV